MNKVRGAASLAAAAAVGITISQAALPALADTLHPKAWGTAVVTIFVVSVTASLERVRVLLTRRRKLNDALRVAPPPPLLAEADLSDLGVYPAGEAAAKAEHEHLRDKEMEVERLLMEIKDEIDTWRESRPRRNRRKNTCWPVIVVGPPQSGKSEVAATAARAVLGGVPAIIPVDADALRGLADGSVALEHPGSAVCIWLDGLDRFVPALDCRGLRELDELKELVVLVATVRKAQWNEMLDGSGQTTENARALAARAGGRVIDLSPEREVVEADARRRAFGASAVPDAESSGAPVRLSRVARPATAGQATAGGPADAGETSDGGSTGDAPATRRTQPSRPRWQWWERWKRAALADRVLGLAVAFMLALAIVFVVLHSQLLEPPPIDSQMNAIRSQLLADTSPTGAHVVTEQQLQLHGNGAPSWVIVFEQYPTHDAWSAAVGDGNHHPYVRSDELRIYDVVDGRLHLGLDFRPRGHGSNAAEWQPLVGAAAAEDYAGDGSKQLIAGYGLPEHENESVMPFAVEWTGDGSAPYRLVTLTAYHRDHYDVPTIPTLSSAGRSSTLQAWYEKPLEMHNAVLRFSNEGLFGFPVEAFAYDRGTDTRPARLLTGYLATDYTSATKPVVVELHASQIRRDSLELRPCTAANVYCPAPACPQDLIVPPAVSVDHALLEAWNRIDTRWDAPVKIAPLTQSRPVVTPRVDRRTAARSHPQPRRSACVS